MAKPMCKESVLILNNIACHKLAQQLTANGMQFILVHCTIALVTQLALLKKTIKQ
jgi:hypothetical protein